MAQDTNKRKFMDVNELIKKLKSDKEKAAKRRDDETKIKKEEKRLKANARRRENLKSKLNQNKVVQEKSPVCDNNLKIKQTEKPVPHVPKIKTPNIVIIKPACISKKNSSCDLEKRTKVTPKNKSATVIVEPATSTPKRKDVKASTKKSSPTSDTKRKKEREKKRKQRAKLNAENIEEKRRKDREYRKKIRDEGKNKLVADLTKRERRIRKKWRESSRKYRQRNKVQGKAVTFLENNTPPSTPDSVSSVAVPAPFCTPAQSTNKKRGRKKVARDRTTAYKKIAMIEAKLKKAKAKVQRYKKRSQRLKKILTPSPCSKVNKMLKVRKVNQSVVRRLALGEALLTEVESRKIELKGDRKSSQILNKILCGKILKRYKMLNYAKQIISHRACKANQVRFKHLTRYERTGKKNSIAYTTGQEIRQFLEEDSNSRMCPGKKDHITKKQVKVQKRVLLDSMKNLYSKFLTVNSNFKLSYSTFLRLRPFWIVRPKFTDRDTCICVKHSNMQFLVVAMNKYVVLPIKKADDLGKTICCDPKSKQCMYRECPNCKNKKISINMGDNDESLPVTYFQWQVVSEERMVRDKQKTVKFTQKTSITSTLAELVQTFHKMVPSFLVHFYNMCHQLNELKQLRENLKPSEVVIQIDFAENYVLKYGEEVQSMHFGASKRQLSLHTGVMYYTLRDQESESRNNENKNVTCVSFASVSENIDHGAHSIWAHLQPLLLKIKDTLPNVKTIHFMSDGPTSQYRNRSNFYLLGKKLPTIIPQINSITWNFSEAGHGKGRMDGVGGTLKHAADVMVSHNRDINDVQSFVGNVGESCPGVTLFKIKSKDIDAMKLELNKTIECIKGIMKIHQVLWSAQEPEYLGVRALSCFSCEIQNICNHFPVSTTGKILFFRNENNTLANNVFISHEVKLPTQAVVNTNNSDSTEVLTGDWVVVLYDNVWYPGKVESTEKNDSLRINFMKHNGGNFVWPSKPDYQVVARDGIICKLKQSPRKLSYRTYAIDERIEINALCFKEMQ